MDGLQVFRQLKLNYSAFALAMVVCSIAQASTPQEEDIERAISRIQHLPELENWELGSTPDSITLTSKFSIDVSASLAIVSDERPGNGEMTEGEIENSTTQSFQIHIHFLPFNAYEDFEELRIKHQTIAEKLNRDAFDFDAEPLGDKAWESLQKSFTSNPVPTHLAGESLVYFSSDLDNTELSFGPSDNLKECIWMQYRLGLLFSEIKR